MIFRQQKIEKQILSYFINCYSFLNQIKYIKKNFIIFYMIFRKFKTKINNKSAKIKFLFFCEFLFLIRYENCIYLLKNQLFLNVFLVILNLYTFFIKKRLPKFNVDKVIEQNFSYWVIKKEYLKIKLNKIDFFILFDNLKIFFCKTKLWGLFIYCQINFIFFKNIMFIYIQLYLNKLDNFMVYLFKKFTQIFYLKTKNKLFLYLRLNNSFLLKIGTKIIYLNQLINEIICFVVYKTKINVIMTYLNVINSKIKNVYFLGLKISFITQFGLLTANIKKIIVRFFFLGYLNHLNNIKIVFNQFLIFNQFFIILKLKLILYSLIFYYKNLKNKKYIIFKILTILKNSICKLLSIKFNYYSKTQILNLFKNDISQFIMKSY